MIDKSTPATRNPGPNRAADKQVNGRAAAQRVNKAEHLAVDLPIVGTVQLPSPEQLAYYGAVGILIALELVDWPLALLVVTGHALAQQQHSRAIQEFGRGLEDA
jgi:hypothetical protein